MAFHVSLSTDQYDRRGERIGSRSYHSITEFSPHGPGPRKCEAGTKNGFQERDPTGAGRLVVTTPFGLLESVVDADGKGRVRLIGYLA